LGELQTIRSGIVAGLTEWKNRKSSGMVDAEAQSLADVTISHFTSQLEAVDEAIPPTPFHASGRHPNQINPIKNPLDSDHGIYRVFDHFRPWPRSRPRSLPAFASLLEEERTLMRQQIQGGLASLIAESVPAKPAHSHGTREKHRLAYGTRSFPVGP
jgi:hypothetical protein